MSETEAKYPGERCECCQCPYTTVWRAPDTLWQRLTGRTDGAGLYCPECFDGLAEDMGVALYWECAEGHLPNEPPRIKTYAELAAATGIPIARLKRLRVFAPESCMRCEGLGYEVVGWDHPGIEAGQRKPCTGCQGTGAAGMREPQTQAAAAIADAAQWPGESASQGILVTPQPETPRSGGR